MSNVVKFPGVTVAPAPVNDILSAAIAANLQAAIVVGADQDGNLYFSGNRSETELINLLLDFAKRQLLDGCAAKTPRAV